MGPVTKSHGFLHASVPNTDFLARQERIAELLWASNAVVNHRTNLIADCTKSYEATLNSLSVKSAKDGIGTLHETTEFTTDGDHNPPSVSRMGFLIWL